MQAFLRQELGNPAIVLKPKTADTIEVFAGDKPAGILKATADTYEWQLVVPLSTFSAGDAVDLKKAEPFLKALLGAKSVAVSSASGGSAEIAFSRNIEGSLIADKSAGTVTLDAFFFADDMPKAADGGTASPGKAAASAIEPVDSANSTYYARMADVKVFDEPAETGTASTTLKEGQQVKVTGRIKGNVGDGWYRLDYADGKPRFAAVDGLIDEKTQQRKQRYGALVNDFPLLMSQTGASSGQLAPYMGFYTLGTECRLQPQQHKPIAGLEKANRISQDVEDLMWSTTSWALWSDGTHLFRLSVDGGKPDRFKPTFVRKVKFKDHGEVQIWRLERIEPAGFDPDLSIVGFTESGKLLLSMQIDGDYFKWARGSSRCSSLGAAKGAISQFYKVWLARLAGQSREEAIGPPPKLLTLDTAANPKFFVRTKEVTLRTTADEKGAVAGDLKEDEEVKLVGVYPVGFGEAWNDRRWWKVETQTGATGFLLGKDLLSEEGHQRKQKLLGNIALLYAAIDKPPYAKGPYVRMAGIFARDGCEQTEPEQIAVDSMLDERKARVQLVANNVWLGRMTFVWFDGNMLNRISLSDPATVRRYRMTPLKTIKLESMGPVRLFKTVQIEGPPDERDDEWSTIGFNDERDILTGVLAEGRSYRFFQKRRCPDRMVIKLQDKAFEIYRKNVNLLPMSREELKVLPN